MSARNCCACKWWFAPAIVLATEPLLAQALPNAAFEQSAPKVDLHWLAPAGCPTGSVVVSEVRELMAGRALLPRASALNASAVVFADTEGFRLLLSLSNSGPPRTRHIGAPTCEELGHAAALIIALALDPTTLTRQPDQETDEASIDRGAAVADHCRCRLKDLPLPVEQVLLPKTSRQTPGSRPSPAEPTPAQLPKPYWRAGLSGLGSFGKLPGFSPAIGVFGAAQGRFLRAELSATFMSSDIASRQQNRFARFDLAYLAPRVCALVISTPVAVGPCAGLELGALVGQGHGVATTYQKWSSWLAASGGAMLELPLASSTFLALTAEVAVPWMKDTFVLAGETLFTLKPSGSVAISLGAGWP